MRTGATIAAVIGVVFFVVVEPTGWGFLAFILGAAWVYGGAILGAWLTS